MGQYSSFAKAKAQIILCFPASITKKEIPSSAYLTAPAKPGTAIAFNPACKFMCPKMAHSFGLDVALLPILLIKSTGTKRTESSSSVADVLLIRSAATEVEQGHPRELYLASPSGSYRD